METSFLELREKIVINIVDGKRLGHIVDLCFDFENGCVLGFVVPGEKSLWNVFKNDCGKFIALSQVLKIGEDAILVEIFDAPNQQYLPCIQAKKK